jgi:hypothetical protein
VVSGPSGASDYYRPTEFRVGRALERAIEVLFGNFVPFIAISALSTVPLVLYQWLAANGSAAAVWIQLSLSLVLSAICQAMILYATFQALRGRPVRIGESLGQGLRRAFPVFVASVVSGLIVVLGFICLIVPGLIALTMFYVTEPACVVERLGPIDSIGRSIDLTRGYRWPVFGAAFVVGIIDSIASGTIGVMLNHPETIAIYLAVIYGWSTLARAYQSVLVAIIYHDLRVVKEGIDLDRIASVFD